MQQWIADGYQQIMEDYIYEFLAHEEEILAGRYSAFDSFYAPVLKKQGVNFVNLAVGGEHTAQVMYSATDRYLFWDAHKKLDCLLTDLEHGSGSFALCRTAADIEAARTAGKIAVLATLSGGKVLEGKSNVQLLSSLRSLYRAGLRSLQLTANGRNRLGDGMAQERTHGRLTDFGIAVVKEADRLSMLIDTAQLSHAGFFDLMENTASTVIDSHTGAAAVCAHPRNISDERIKAIAQRGGVIGLSFRCALVAQDKDAPTTEDLFRHVDHIAALVGPQHIAFGPDYSPIQTPIDRQRIKGHSVLSPDFSPMDYKTPAQSEKYPGVIDGIWHGIREDDFIKGGAREAYGALPALMAAHGYAPDVIDGIMGENLVRVYKAALGRAAT